MKNFNDLYNKTIRNLDSIDFKDTDLIYESGLKNLWNSMTTFGVDKDAVKEKYKKKFIKLLNEVVPSCNGSFEEDGGIPGRFVGEKKGKEIAVRWYPADNVMKILLKKSDDSEKFTLVAQTQMDAHFTKNEIRDAVNSLYKNSKLVKAIENANANTSVEGSAGKEKKNNWPKIKEELDDIDNEDDLQYMLDKMVLAKKHGKDFKTDGGNVIANAMIEKRIKAIIKYADSDLGFSIENPLEDKSGENKSDANKTETSTGSVEKKPEANATGSTTSDSVQSTGSEKNYKFNKEIRAALDKADEESVKNALNDLRKARDEQKDATVFGVHIQPNHISKYITNIKQYSREKLGFTDETFVKKQQRGVKDSNSYVVKTPKTPKTTASDANATANADDAK